MILYKSLIDGVVTEHDGFCYTYGLDITKRKCRVSYQGTLSNFDSTQENRKVAGGGHVYVLNYNPKTYTPKYPETFEEFRENGSKF